MAVPDNPSVLRRSKRIRSPPVHYNENLRVKQNPTRSKNVASRRRGASASILNPATPDSDLMDVDTSSDMTRSVAISDRDAPLVAVPAPPATGSRKRPRERDQADRNKVPRTKPVQPTARARRAERQSRIDEAKVRAAALAAKSDLPGPTPAKRRRVEKEPQPASLAQGVDVSGSSTSTSATNASLEFRDDNLVAGESQPPTVHPETWDVWPANETLAPTLGTENLWPVVTDAAEDEAPTPGAAAPVQSAPAAAHDAPAGQPIVEPETEQPLVVQEPASRFTIPDWMLTIPPSPSLLANVIPTQEGTSTVSRFPSLFLPLERKKDKKVFPALRERFARVRVAVAVSHTARKRGMNFIRETVKKEHVLFLVAQFMKKEEEAQIVELEANLTIVTPENFEEEHLGESSEEDSDSDEEPDEAYANEDEMSAHSVPGESILSVTVDLTAREPQTFTPSWAADDLADGFINSPIYAPVDEPVFPSLVPNPVLAAPAPVLTAPVATRPATAFLTPPRSPTPAPFPEAAPVARPPTPRPGSSPAKRTRKRTRARKDPLDTSLGTPPSRTHLNAWLAPPVPRQPFEKWWERPMVPPPVIATDLDITQPQPRRRGASAPACKQSQPRRRGASVPVRTPPPAPAPQQVHGWQPAQAAMQQFAQAQEVRREVRYGTDDTPLSMAMFDPLDSSMQFPPEPAHVEYWNQPMPDPSTTYGLSPFVYTPDHASASGSTSTSGADPSMLAPTSAPVHGFSFTHVNDHVYTPAHAPVTAPGSSATPGSSSAPTPVWHAPALQMPDQVPHVTPNGPPGMMPAFPEQAPPSMRASDEWLDPVLRSPPAPAPTTAPEPAPEGSFAALSAMLDGPQPQAGIPQGMPEVTLSAEELERLTRPDACFFHARFLDCMMCGGVDCVPPWVRPAPMQMQMQMQADAPQATLEHNAPPPPPVPSSFPLSPSSSSSELGQALGDVEMTDMFPFQH
ncbi:hypothetical protein OBBRIDRAFT_835669 [Obba rivulosa]|uniref:Uncharacterized protein n=1 Tax=Obba rivulosa TaxID=1052685 RepID=A0A8E2AWW7_9APHY|nr:hypothetical protein OBBRIDRAFT_835669 [Obba rivulosa]